MMEKLRLINTEVNELKITLKYQIQRKLHRFSMKMILSC